MIFLGKFFSEPLDTTRHLRTMGSMMKRREMIAGLSTACLLPVLKFGDGKEYFEHLEIVRVPVLPMNARYSFWTGVKTEPEALQQYKKLMSDHFYKTNKVIIYTVKVDDHIRSAKYILMPYYKESDMT